MARLVSVPDVGSDAPTTLVEAYEGPALRLPDRQAHVVQLALVWNGRHLLDVREAAPGETLRLGATADVEVPIFHAATASGPRPILRVNRDATCTVWLPVEARSLVQLDGAEFAVTDLIETGRGRAVRSPTQAVECTLGLADRASLTFGAVQLLVRFARPIAGTRSPFGAAFATRVVWYVVGAATAWAAQELAFGPRASGVLLDAQEAITDR